MLRGNGDNIRDFALKCGRDTTTLKLVLQDPGVSCNLATIGEIACESKVVSS